MDHKIIVVTETKVLCIIIDYEMNWSPHMMYVSKKVAKGISIILKMKVFDQETMLTLYYTFFSTL